MTGKQIGICPYNGKLLSSKKKQTIDTQNNVNDFQKFFSIFMLKKKSQTKEKYVLYNSIHMKIWKMQTTVTKIRSMVVWGWGGGKGWIIKGSENF